ncbi:MAG: dihydroxyacetone kinase subunit DhaL [Candidatus Limnocylindria bacterium]
MGSADFVRFIELFAARLRDRRQELTDLDSKIGDADHGINMDRGFTAVTVKLPDVAGSDLGALSKTVGMTLISTVGGASGPLYGTFFLRLATAFGDRVQAEPADLGAALRAGLEGVQARGHAVLDDKTMVDAMLPAVAAYEASVANGGLAHALRAAAEAAAIGRDRVTPLVARKGRASYLGERSAGHQDPGATSTTILFESLRDAVVDTDSGG